MWNRIQYADVAVPVTIVAFIITVAAYVYYLLKTFRMDKQERKRLSEMPLKDD